MLRLVYVYSTGSVFSCIIGVIFYDGVPLLDRICSELSVRCHNCCIYNYMTSVVCLP